MAARVGQQPILVFTLTTTFQGVLERWRLAHVYHSELAHNGTYPDGCPSRSTTYTGVHLDNDPLGGFLKSIVYLRPT